MTDVAVTERSPVHNGPDQGLPGQQWAVTERGKVIHKTENEVKAFLKLLALNGGQQRPTAEQLKEEGVELKENTLAWWRDKSFPRLYMQIRKEVGRDVGEQIAGKALERALEADDAEQVYLQEAKAKVKKVKPEHLAKGALALAQAKGQNIEKAALLRHEPTQILEIDINASIEVLERLGVVEKEPAIDAEVVE